METKVLVRANSTLKFKTPTGSSIDWQYAPDHDFSKITEEMIRHAIAWCGEDMRDHLIEVAKSSKTSK